MWLSALKKLAGARSLQNLSVSDQIYGSPKFKPSSLKSILWASIASGDSYNSVLSDLYGHATNLKSRGKQKQPRRVSCIHAGPDRSGGRPADCRSTYSPRGSRGVFKARDFHSYLNSNSLTYLCRRSDCRATYEWLNKARIRWHSPVILGTGLAAVHALAAGGDDLHLDGVGIHYSIIVMPYPLLLPLQYKGGAT